MSGCSAASGPKSSAPEGKSTLREAFEAATSPLEDFNLRRKEIPPLLQTIVANPYAHPEKVKCAELTSEITQLDSLLGPDIAAMDVVELNADNSLGASLSSSATKISEVEIPETQEIMDEGEKLARSSAMGFIRDQTSITPFRSMVRRISGADRHAKKVSQAFQAGQLRRAYLKGLAEVNFGRSCLSPPVILEVRAANVP
ncbi:MAG: hypothetical protein V4735_06860 [Pseudomonadota bacterium]